MCRLTKWLVLSFLAAATCACQEPRIDVQAPRSLDKLLSGELFFDGVNSSEFNILSVLPEEDIFRLTPEMISFLDFYIPKDASAKKKVELLMVSVGSSGGLNLKFDATKTRTARESFIYQDVNCLSYAILVVALARYAGVPADFNDVSVPPVWDLADGSTVVFYKHVNVELKFGHGMAKIIDINLDAYQKRYPQRLISSREAEAQYYNNLGVDYMRQGQYKKAFLYLRKALQLDDSLPYVWGNLGALYRRAGDSSLAEQAFSQALSMDTTDIVTLSNLARLK